MSLHAGRNAASVYLLISDPYPGPRNPNAASVAARVAKNTSVSAFLTTDDLRRGATERMEPILRIAPEATIPLM
jgi:hypothetical protein